MAGINRYTVTNPNTSAATAEYLWETLREQQQPRLGVERELPDDVAPLHDTGEQALDFTVESVRLNDDSISFIGRSATGGSVRLEVSQSDPYSPAHASVVEQAEPPEEA